jgi:hypothetical protein
MASDTVTFKTAGIIVAAFILAVGGTAAIIDRINSKPSELSEIPALRDDVAEVGQRVARVEGKLDVLLLKDRPRSAGYAAKE